MTRTTITLPDTLHQQLAYYAGRMKIPLAHLIRDLLDQALSDKEQKRIKRMYNDLKELQGICKEDVTDASISIDDVLYRENNASGDQSAK